MSILLNSSVSSEGSDYIKIGFQHINSPDVKEPSVSLHKNIPNGNKISRNKAADGGKVRSKLIEICFLIRSGIPAILARVLANISLLFGGGRLIVRNGMGGSPQIQHHA